MNNQCIRICWSFILFLFVTPIVFGQNNWEISNNQKTKQSIDQEGDFPPLFKAGLTHKAMAQIWGSTHGLASKGSFSLINENGEEEAFSLESVSILSESVASEFPSIHAYRGVSQQRKNIIVRLTVTPLGLHGAMKTPKGDFIFQPIKGQKKNYLFYLRNSMEGDAQAAGIKCSTPPLEKIPFSETTNTQARNAQNNSFKTFRFAVAATGEYTSYWGDDNPENGSNIEDAFAAIVNTVNRMNEVLETDMGIRLLLVSNAASYVFEDAALDPFSDDLNSEVQSLLTSQLGEANYDVGHLFHRSVPNGDAGSIGNVCRNGRKGSAFSAHSFTATNGSEGEFLTDYFDVDYVLHEVGHQFGATHSFSHETEGTGTNSEPGSGSTIMSYAGIVSGQNIQLHSDPYFHAHSIRQMKSYLSNYACQETVESNHQPPTVNAGPDITIPSMTPYQLEAQGSDPDGNALTYCWEQMDSGLVQLQSFGTQLLSGSTARSLPPSTSSIRTIPNMQSVLANQLSDSNPGQGSFCETVIEATRTLKWGVTVRDRNQAQPNGFGYTDYDEKSISVISSAGPFRVLSQAEASQIWQSGQTVEVNWDVAKTDLSPISTQFVDIYLSSNGGQEFNIPLLENTPNDGQALITVPAQISSTNARIKITPTNNIYFAVNAQPFSIVSKDFSVATTQAKAIACNSRTVTYTYQYTSFDNASRTIALSVANLPENITHSFSTATLSSAQASGVLTLTAPEGYQGDFQFSLVGTASATTVQQPLGAVFALGDISIPTLISPANQSINQPNQVTLSWEAQDISNGYRIEVSNNPNFDPLLQVHESSVNSVTIKNLSSLTTYYWRVINKTICDANSTSAPYQFTVTEITCEKSYEAAGLPIPIQDATEEGNDQTTRVNINVEDDFTIIDINVKVRLTHTYLKDLTLVLVAPNGQRIVLSKNIGDGGHNYTNTVFDAEATLSVISGTPPYTGTFKPTEDLSVLYNTSALGIWQFEVSDNFPVQTGSIDFVELQFCQKGSSQVNSDGDLIVDSLDNCPLIDNQDQLDSDNDGEGDLCDINAQRNFTLSKTDETCIEKNNGSIKIQATALFEYTATVTGPNGYLKVNDFSTTPLRLENLSHGDYLACITSSGRPDFKQCFAIKIDQPAPLSVAARVNSSARTISLAVQGSDAFTLVHNETQQQISGKNQLEISLKEGLNIIEISTPLQCQGVFKKHVYIDNDSALFPNPARDQLSLLIGGSEAKVMVFVYDIQGQEYYKKTHQLLQEDRNFDIDISQWPTGNYILKLQRNGIEETLKFIKR